MLLRIRNELIINTDKIVSIHVSYHYSDNDDEPPTLDIDGICIKLDNDESYAFDYNNAYNVLEKLSIENLGIDINK